MLTRPYALYRDLKVPIIHGNSKTPPLREEGKPRKNIFGAERCSFISSR
jgi:hypothetical protein